MTLDGALATLDRFYAAALGEAPWEDALTLLADGMGGAATTLEMHDVPSRGMLAFESVRVDPREIATYARDYAADNPRVNYLRSSDAVLAFDHLFITDEEIDRNPYYCDFLAPTGLRYFVSAHMPLVDGRAKGAVAVQFSGAERGADMERVEQFRRLQPHISRALALYWRRLRFSFAPEFFDITLSGHGLTPAERRLAAALVLGEALPTYARRNGVSMNTVYTHYRRLKMKLDCASQAELLARLHALGGTAENF